MSQIRIHLQSQSSAFRPKKLKRLPLKPIGDADGAVAKPEEAAAIEDAIDDLSQPPYPVIPANELCGNLLLELNRFTEAVT